MPARKPIADIADERESLIGGGGPGVVLELVEQPGYVAALDARKLPASPSGQNCLSR